MKKTLAISAGIVAALGIIVLPLTSYAASDTKDVTVTVRVGTGIQLTVDGDKMINMNSGEFNEATTTTANVKTNNATGYNLTVADQDTNNALVKGGDNIPAQSGQPVAGTAGWAIKGGAVGTYTAVPISTAPALQIYTQDTATGSAGVDTVITYGVATNFNQATGDYVDTIVYTATTK